MKRLAVLALVPLLSAAERPGDDALAAGDFARAVALYEKAELRSTEPAAVAFKLATANYRLAREKGDARALAAAEQGFRCGLAEGNPRRPESMFGVGACLLLRGGGDRVVLRAAIDAFSACLAEAGVPPELKSDARHNRQRARLLLLQTTPRADDPDDDPPGDAEGPDQPKQPEKKQAGNDDGPGKGKDPAAKPDNGDGKEGDGDEKGAPSGRLAPPPISNEPDGADLSAGDAADHLKRAAEAIRRDTLDHRRKVRKAAVPGARLVIALLLALCPGVEPPLVGRPIDVPFSDASAPYARGPGGELLAPFVLGCESSATSVRLDEKFLYSVTVRALVKGPKPPTVLAPQGVPSFSRAFYIEDVSEGPTERPGEWRWVFRLRAKGSDVTAIPGYPFCYYNSDVRPPEKGFHTLYTDPLPLTVTEVEVPVPRSLASMRDIVEGEAVERKVNRWPGPSWLLTSSVLVAPSLPALGAWLLWRALWPDAAKRASLHRSRAARRALKSLAGAERLPPPAQAERCAAALAAYLRERFDLASAAPTPAEARLALSGRVADPSPLVAALSRCDEARFGAAPLPTAAEARAAVVAAEEGACSPPS